MSKCSQILQKLKNVLRLYTKQNYLSYFKEKRVLSKTRNWQNLWPLSQSYKTCSMETFSSRKSLSKYNYENIWKTKFSSRSNMKRKFKKFTNKPIQKRNTSWSWALTEKEQDDPVLSPNCMPLQSWQSASQSVISALR